MTATDLPAGPVRLVDRRSLGTLRDDGEFLENVRPLASSPYSAVLLSGGDPPVQDESRYSLAAWDPMLVLESKGNRSALFGIDGSREWSGDPLLLVDELFRNLPADFPPVFAPFSGGAVGYFAYELKNVIERLPQTAVDDLDLPDLLLIWPRRVRIYDRIEKSLHELHLALTKAPLGGLPPSERGGLTPLSSPPRARNPVDTPCGVQFGTLSSNFTHEDYLGAVAKVRDYIIAGDVYQVNLSQRLQFPFEGDPFELWKGLFTLNPAPFYAFIRGRDHQVLSTSMERFLFRRGSYLETRPIKGTRKRGRTPREDETLKQELLRDPKDDAELSMIVDLLRNDLGRVCLPRSIRVREHKRLESYQNVHHLVSIVTGELRAETTYGELLRAAFPGGSVTGCPKIRAMEIIDELEPQVRHVYTGAIGYLGFHRNLDLNVAIRTAIVHKGIGTFSVGGGIVFDSKEEDEYQETLHKGRTLLQLVESLRRNHP